MNMNPDDDDSGVDNPTDTVPEDGQGGWGDIIDNTINAPIDDD